MFEKTGCEECRDAWSMPFKAEKILQEIGDTNFKRQARLFQCAKCGSFWEDNNGSYPSGLTKEDAEKYYGVS
ncbi:MAG: hypothetical protein ACRBBM_19105 [Pseudomonadaceae bacterium]|jgi:uncharacterized protein with PIN domain